MQTKLIKIGTEYAYAKSWEWNNHRRGRNAERVVVLETNARPTNDERRLAFGRISNATVRVRFPDRKRRDDGSEQVTLVAPIDIREEWAIYAPAAAEAEKRAREDREERIANQKAMKVRLDAIWAKLPEGTPRPYFAEAKIWGDGSMSIKGEISNSELATLLEAALKAGWSEGWDARAADEQDEEA